MIHAAGRVALERRAITLNNFAAYKGYHPVGWRPDRAPEHFIGCIECVNLTVLDLLSYEARSAGRIDWVLLWRPQVVDGVAYLGGLSPQLRSHFEPVCRSKPGGHGLLLRRRAG